MLMSAPNCAPYSRPKKTNVSHNAPLSETCNLILRKVKACGLVVSLAVQVGFVYYDDPVLGTSLSSEKRGSIADLCKEGYALLDLRSV